MATAELQHPNALVSGDWLEQQLHDPNLRIFDCSTQLIFEEDGDRPYRVMNCRQEHETGHIPGASYFDLQAEFSVQNSRFAMTLADPETVSKAFARNGVADGTRVILYSRRSISWATRFWWMLRWLGFDNAAILDGGYDKWIIDGRPTSTDHRPYPKGEISVNLRPDLFVGKEDVLNAMDNPATCTINALGADIFSGENPRYGRRGRIPGSESVPQVSLLDPKTLEFLPLNEIAEKFSAVGADRAQNHISYCGGGIFATVDAFWLHQLGHRNIAVYENSMSEWGPDESLPIEHD